MEINIKEFQSLSDEKCRYELRITELVSMPGDRFLASTYNTE